MLHCLTEYQGILHVCGKWTININTCEWVLEHGAEKSTESLQGEIKSKETMIPSDVTTEWKLHG